MRSRRFGTRAAVALLALLAVVGAALAVVRPWGDGSARGARAGFVASDRSGPAVVWAVGDGDGSEEARALAGRIGSERVDRLLYLGDVYDDGTAADFRSDYAPTYGRFASITAPTPGNHDWENRAEGYQRYWRRVRGKRAPAYYAFSVGGWQVLSLNSEAPHAEGSAQLRWLGARLRRPGTCRLAFWHRPRFSAGDVHGDDADVAPIWDALRGRASLVVNGHEHNLQRLRPIDGITQLIAGAGGHGLYPIAREDPRLAFGNDSSYAALRLELEQGRAAYAFVDATGRELDAGRVRCRIAPPRS